MNQTPPKMIKKSPKSLSKSHFDISKQTYDELQAAMKLMTAKSELECKFKMPLDKAAFTHVLQYYRSAPKTTFKEQIHDDQLDVFCRLPTMPSNIIRATIIGKENINEYCKTNVAPSDLIAIFKKQVKGVKPINIPDLGFKVDLKDEIPLDDIKRQELFAIINSTSKGFRYKKRFSYISADFQYDFSLIKTSPLSLRNNEFLTHSTFALSGTLSVPESYEIEIEVLKPQSSAQLNKFIEAMMTVYLVYNKEQYYISPSQRLAILTNYTNLIFPNDKTALTQLEKNPRKYFAAPQPVTLEKKNLLEPELDIVSIKTNYTVTEKADGERYLMFIDNSGSVYLIDSRLNIKCTGVKLQSLVNTLLDGEFVTKDAVGKRTKIFAVFDIYFYNSQDVRNNPLIPKRLNFMKEIELKYKSKFQDKGFQFMVKQFLTNNIFKDCETILTQSHHYPYEIDGLIFTPADLSVGASRPGEQVSIATSFSTWDRVFKYKPPEQNSIDFLVRYGSLTTQPNDPIAMYQELELYVGYNPQYPLQWDRLKTIDVLSGKLTLLPPRQNTYLPRRFEPPDVLDGSASTAYVALTQNQPKALNGDIINDNTIVEFSWINNQWVPIRVRHDKTELLRKQGLSRTANDIKSAMNVWQTINDPVTDDMIKGHVQVTPDMILDNQETYYFRSTARDKMATKKMLDFHNYYIKNKCLIAAYPPQDQPKRNKSIFDIACGKAGDLNKWVDAGFKRILGVDYARDNIENPLDGAYARTLEKKQREQHGRMNISYMYLTLDGGREFNEDYFNTLENPDDKYLAKLAWGYERPKDNQALTTYYNFAKPNSFDVVSCQFAIHYFFESSIKLDNFLSNVNHHLAPGGYFIGTCLNANKIKDKLRQQSTDILTGKLPDGKIIWNIKKLSDTEVEIYMESINKRMKEYFVDFDLLVSKLQKYNIQLVKPITSFEEEFINLTSQSSTVPSPSAIIQNILTMTPVEKEYSFLNSYFVFQKQA